MLIQFIQLEALATGGVRTIKNYKTNLIFSLIIMLYIGSLVLIGYFMVVLPNLVSDLQENYYHKMKEQIQASLLLPEQDRKDMLASIDFEERVEFFIVDANADEVVYTTLPIASVDEFYGVLNQNAISVEENFMFSPDEGREYRVWLAVYVVSPQKELNFWVFFLLTVIIILITLLIVITLIVFRTTLKPLQRLRDNIWKLRAYQLEQLQNKRTITDYDALSYELISFAHDLRQKMTSVDVTYTSLERELQMQKEVMKYRTEMLATLAHDLKVPVHIIQLQLEKIMSTQVTEEEREKQLIESYSKLNRLTADINDIVKVAHSDNLAVLLEKETFNLARLLSKEYQSFIPLYEEKAFEVEVIVDPEVLIFANVIQFRQLIHNALSNIYHYALHGATVIISCYCEDEMIHLTFYNDAKQMSEEQLENIFHLFYRVSEDEQGSGTGLHTMKSTTQENHGDVRMINKDEGVELQLFFPQEMLRKEKESDERDVE